MNFFQRRKILRKANFLELTPLKVMEFKMTEEGRVDVLYPRFKSRFWKDVYRRSKKGEFIPIHLDETGSAIWLLIDGQSNVEKICELMNEKSLERFTSTNDLHKRITQFLSLLYQQRYITFREIQTHDE